MDGRLVTRRRRMWATGGAVVLAAGVASFVGLRGHSAPVPKSPRPGGRTSTSLTAGSGVRRQAGFRVVSIEPRNGAVGVAGSARVSITFSGPVSRTSPMPALNPSVPGTWHVTGGRTLVFTPSEPFIPLSQVTLTIPSGLRGPLGAKAASSSAAVVDNFTIADGSTLRLQELLSILDYSPLTWL
ncbi:MAG: Ig-like domain-containing protein, partial [Actinomycetota bacterium]|nr:Ig-like domain-containing protein [Actinomycetota bacterium]